jgi:hypothetical protein
MITTIHFNSILAGGGAPAHLSHLWRRESALPDIEAIKRSAAELDRAAAKINAERTEHQRETFGARIANIVRSRQRQRVTATDSAEEPSDFGDAVRAAVQRKIAARLPTKKEHEAFKKRDAERYRYAQRRPRTKSD